MKPRLARFLFDLKRLVIDATGERTAMTAKAQGGDTVRVQGDAINACRIDALVLTYPRHEVLLIVHLGEVKPDQISAQVHLRHLQVNMFAKDGHEERLHFGERITRPCFSPKELRREAHLGNEIIEGTLRDGEGEQARCEQLAPLPTRAVRLDKERDTQE